MVMSIEEMVAGIGPSTLGRKPGDPITATLVVKHSGGAATVKATWWLAPGDNVPFVYHKDAQQFVGEKVVSVPAHATPTTVQIVITGVMPSIQPLSGENFFDSRVTIVDNATGAYVAGNASDVMFDDTHYRSDLVAAQFSDMTAVFS